MRIVEINTVNGIGSTGKIAAALYNLAKSENHEPYIAYGRGDAPANIDSFKIGNTFDFGTHVLSNFFCGNSGFASRNATKKFLQWLDHIQPDLLHLHNLHGFYIHVGLLFEYIKKHNIPVIWTLHDCWPFTGQCAYFDYAECKKWKTQCHSCPIYKTDYPYSLFKDNSKQNYIQKKEAFTGVNNMIIITPSHWLASLVGDSYLNEYPVNVIPNGIDLTLFKPLSIPISDAKYQNKKILLGVANVWDKRKGLDYFLDLSKMLDDDFHIVLIGVSKKQQDMIQKKYAANVTAITRTANQKELVSWYNAAYAFVNPTLEDNFPTTNLEALACGTPVITFNTGGSPESINDTCGIVVEKGNVQKLKDAIVSLETNHLITKENCRKQAEKYDKNVLFREYLRLYKNI